MAQGAASPPGHSSRTDGDTSASKERSPRLPRAIKSLRVPAAASGQARAAKKSGHRSNDVGNDVANDVGNETRQSSEQPIPDHQEVREGDSAPPRAHAAAPVPSPEAFELAAAYRKAVGCRPRRAAMGRPALHGAGLGHVAATTRAAVLAFGSDACGAVRPEAR